MHNVDKAVTRYLTPDGKEITEQEYRRLQRGSQVDPPQEDKAKKPRKKEE